MLNDLRLAGVELTAAGGKLRYRAPSGALSDNLRAAMQARKAERLALLQAGTGESQSTVPPARAAEPGRATSGENRAVMPKVGTDQSTPTVPTSGCCRRDGRSCPIPAYWPARGGRGRLSPHQQCSSSLQATRDARAGLEPASNRGGDAPPLTPANNVRGSGRGDTAAGDRKRAQPVVHCLRFTAPSPAPGSSPAAGHDRAG